MKKNKKLIVREIIFYLAMAVIISLVVHFLIITYFNSWAEAFSGSNK